MMGNAEILVVLSRPAAAAGCLDAAAQAAAALPSPHITALHVRPDPLATILPSEEVLSEQQLLALRRQAEADHAALRATYRAWQPDAPPSSWVELEGVPAEEVLPWAKAAALVVMTLPGPHPPRLEREAFDAALFACRQPLLAVPAGWSGRFGRHLAIGWRDSPDTRAALVGAGPWLARAEHITVIEVAAQPSGTAPPLPSGWQGRRDTITVPAHAEGEGAALLDAALQAGADGLVLGAYRRGRVLEWVLGGVTEHVLHHARLPLLLKH